MVVVLRSLTGPAEPETHYQQSAVEIVNGNKLPQRLLTFFNSIEAMM